MFRKVFCLALTTCIILFTTLSWNSVAEAPAECPEINLPAASALTYSNDKMPDPFEFKFMKLPRVATKAQWECRRQEIWEMAQDYVYGHLGPKPEVTGSVNDGTISINCSYEGKTANFSVNTQGSGNILVVDFMGGAPVPDDSRRCNFNPANMLAHMKTLYGSTDAGTCMAAAWGVGRIIDVLEQNPDSGIDPTKVITTGCSFAGKYAAIAAVFEPRVAIGIPVEPGACGATAWRVGKAYGGSNTDVACQDIEHLEQNWLGEVAGPFRNGQVSIDKLPLDQHEILALRAPYPMLVFNNSKDWAWLCAKGNVATAQGCRAIYKALGVADHFGFAESGASHGHCRFPEEHKAELQAFYDKFLNGDESANTDIMRWHQDSDEREKWFDWDMDGILE